MHTPLKNTICTLVLICLISFGYSQTSPKEDLKLIRNLEVITKTVDDKGNIEIDLGTKLTWNIMLYKNQSDLVSVMPYTNGKITLSDLEPGVYDLEITSENGSGRRYYGLDLKLPEMDKTPTSQVK